MVELKAIFIKISLVYLTCISSLIHASDFKNRFSGFWIRDEKPRSELSGELRWMYEPRFSACQLGIAAQLGMNSGQRKASFGKNYRFLNFKAEIEDKGYFDLDRLKLECSLNQLNLSIGRQAISLATARIISTHDIILPFNLDTIDRSYRPGVDSLRLRYYNSPMSELDFAILMDGNNPTSFISQRVSWQDIDWKFIAISSERFLHMGLSMEGYILASSYWLEIAQQRLINERAFTRSSFGLDYNFSSQVYLILEYHYNGAYRLIAKGLDKKLRLLEEAGIFLDDAQYLSLQLSYPLTPLLGLSYTQIASPNNSLNTILASYSLSDNSDLQLGLIIPTAASNKQFADYSTSVVVRSQWYF